MRAPIRLRSVLRWFLLLVAAIVAVPGCDIFNKYGNWVASNEPPPPLCMGGGGGAGGDSGAGGIPAPEETTGPEGIQAPGRALPT